MPEVRCQRRDVLQVAIPIRRDGDLRRLQLKALEDENRRLKKLLAESMLDASTLKEMLGRTADAPGFREPSADVGSPGEGLLAAASLWARRSGIRRRIDMRQSGLSMKGLRRQLRELASQRRRFGYRRLGLMLERQGIKLNRKKLYRLYKEERLMGAQARWPQTGSRYTGADGGSPGPRICVGRSTSWRTRW